MATGDLASNQKRFLPGASINNMDARASSLNKKRLRPPAASTSTLPKDFRELGPTAAPCCPPDQELPPRSPPWGQRSSSPSQDEAGGGAGHMVGAKSGPAPGPAHKVELHKSNKLNMKDNRSSSKKPRPLPGGGSTHIRASRRSPAPVATSSRVKHLPVSVADKHHHHGNHHHHRLHAIAKPKHKRSQPRVVMEVAHHEAFRCTRQRQRKERLSQSAAGAHRHATGSDSEYSAECASLFHSTIVDTSEDERSNYTTNCFGDSESSEDEYVEDSSAASDTEESGGGGRSHLGPPTARQEVSRAQAKAFVKIKASHNLKKKILRFRTGSLKLMTTV